MGYDRKSYENVVDPHFAAIYDQTLEAAGEMARGNPFLEIIGTPLHGGNPSPSGVKHDQEKPDMSLLSSIAMVKIAEVMTYGKKKYSAHNWRGGLGYSRLLAAALRHTFSYLGGEDKDPETGLSHLAHASCCLMMLLEQETTRPDMDDRYSRESK